MKANQGITYYKRHSDSCPISKLDIPANAKRYQMDCECTVWVVGRTPAGDILPRQSTGEKDLKLAERVVSARLAQVAATSKPDAVHGPTIGQCVEKYLASRRHELGEKTLGQYRLLLERLTRFCGSQGVLYAQDVNVDLLETFKVEGLPEDMADTSRATAVAKLRCFLRTAYRRDWVTESLADKVMSHKAVYEQKEPYSNEEVEKILDEALKLNGGTHGYAKHPRTFRLLLELMLETGIRVGDAIRFNPGELMKGEHLWVYTFLMQKQKKTEKPRHVEAYITNRLKTEIDNCEWLSSTRPFMWGKFKNAAYLANEVYYRMQSIGQRCGVLDCRPHRLRDTFAVRKLLAGFQLDDVSRLLGHSSVKVTETYYAKWVSSRKLRLERLVAESLVNPQSDALRN